MHQQSHNSQLSHLRVAFVFYLVSGNVILIVAAIVIVQRSSSGISGEPDFLPTTAGSLC
ncbi:hypothetical protein [Undibacterium luofuense]|uniref:Uncharacterized protein n=1 Tax=Undibacterium luofuense TaxID=2828733 RepID=A0A941DIK2_9BURK|nr:hypothetical protein [Undibacterium luofuense]MBR7780660.1 hypothetical protein [Undibacterium luofuense]